MKIARHLMLWPYFRQLTLKIFIHIRSIFCDNKDNNLPNEPETKKIWSFILHWFTLFSVFAFFRSSRSGKPAKS